MTNVRSQFRDAILAVGMVPPDDMKPGVFHRFPGMDKDTSNRAGWCKLFEDGAGGIYGDFSTGLSKTWQLEQSAPMTEQERRSFAKMVKDAKGKAEEERNQTWRQAAAEAREKWHTAQPGSGGYKYLQAKQVKAYGIRTDGLALLAPIYIDGEITSLQTIMPDGGKRFHPGGRIAGGYFLIGKPDGVLCIAEGYATAASLHEATGYSVVVAFNAGNLLAVAQDMYTKYPDLKLVLCADNDIEPDRPNPGIDAATQAAKAVGGYLAIPDLGNKKCDFNDVHLAHGLTAVRKYIEAAMVEPPLQESYDADTNLESPTNPNAVVTELASLSPLEYDQQRECKAKELGVRIGTLDRAVAEARSDIGDDAVQSIVEELEPWPDAINGDTLLREIASILSRYVYLPRGAVTVLATWCLGTYIMEAWTIWPKLLITSPEKRCGKSTLVDSLESLTYRALVASNISPSAIFRCIEEWQPTLILDEADTFTKDNDELNGIINAGHRKRTAKVIRSEKVNDGFIPKAYSVWSPQVIAGIGSQRDTLHDRSIHIEMERKLPDEQVSKIPHDLFEKCQDLRRKCQRWALDNVRSLKGYIEIPNFGNDRAQDNWEPLVRIGVVAGGDWQQRILHTYKLFAMVQAETEDVGILLLRDIQVIMSKWKRDKITSAELVEGLVSIEESPWSEWKRGKPMTQISLARLLKPFKVKPKDIRIGQTVRRGFEAKQFSNVFSRYLQPLVPPTQSATPLQSSNDGASRDFQGATKTEDVALSKPSNPLQDKACSTVALQNIPMEDQGHESSAPREVF